jgi:hypothetical protein
MLPPMVELILISSRRRLEEGGTQSWPEAESLSCNSKKGYFGPLCGACDRDNDRGGGFFTRSGALCAQCWDDVGSYFAVLGLIVLLLIGMCHLVLRHSFNRAVGDYSATVQKIAMSHLQMLGVLGIFKARGTKVFNEVLSRPAEVLGGSLTSMLPVKCAMKSQIYGPFIMNMAAPPILVSIAVLMIIPMKLWEDREHASRKEGETAPVFKGSLYIPRRLARYTFCRAPMFPEDIEEWNNKFSGRQRLAGVTVFILFTLYPTLVGSIASLYNCSSKIEGVIYLVADFTVVCYDRRHMVFVALATVGAVVYSLGIPIAVAVVTAMKAPCAWPSLLHPCRCCSFKRRPRFEYEMVSTRARFAFLFNGYSTDRAAYVVAWEAVVMLRKLAVTLAGSVIKDPVSLTSKVLFHVSLARFPFRELTTSPPPSTSICKSWLRCSSSL